MPTWWRRFCVILVLIAEPALARGPVPLEAYGELPSVEEMKVSPNGKFLAFVTKVKGERQLIVTGEGGEVRSVQGLGDTRIYAIDWAGDDLLVATKGVTKKSSESLAKKYELLGAVVLNLADKTSGMVLKPSHNAPSAILWQGKLRKIDGKWFGYYAGWSVHAFPNLALFAVDLANNNSRKVIEAKGGGRYYDWLVDSRGNVAAELEFIAQKNEWRILNSSQAVIASGFDPNGDMRLVAFGQDANSVIYTLENDERELLQYFEVPLAGGDPREILADAEVERTYVDPLSDRLLGYLQKGSGGRAVMFDPAHQEIFDKLYKAFAQFDLSIVNWTPDFRYFIVLTRGNGDSGTYFLVDMGQLKADPVGFERPQIGAGQVGPVSLVEYQASDGLDLDGILTVPPDREARNLPLIMMPHDGPNRHDRKTFDWLAQAFASRGYAVFQPNFRGSTNRDYAFQRAGSGEWGRKMQTDISDGLAELTKRRIVDPHRACIMGSGYGGYTALAGVTLQQGLYRCAVAVAPISDLKLRYNAYSRATRRNKMKLSNLTELMGDPSTYDEVSPRRFANRADAPILLLHGRDDTFVDIRQSEAMADALKQAGKLYEFVLLPEMDHQMLEAETRKQVLQAAMRFVQTHNPAY